MNSIRPYIDAVLQTCFHEYGIGPWEIHEFNPSTVEQMTKDDRSAEYAMRIARI